MIDSNLDIKKKQALINFSAGGFKDFTRIGSSDPKMWTDIFSMNEKNISIAIEELIQNLNLLKDQITNDPKILRNFLIELKDFKESNY